MISFLKSLIMLMVKRLVEMNLENALIFGVKIKTIQLINLLTRHSLEKLKNITYDLNLSFN